MDVFQKYFHATMKLAHTNQVPLAIPVIDVSRNGIIYRNLMMRKRLPKNRTKAKVSENQRVANETGSYLILDNSLNDSLPLRPVRNVTNNARRYRSSFNAEQIELLEQTFSHTPYPDVTTREQLAHRLNIEENRIQVRALRQLM